LNFVAAKFDPRNDDLVRKLYLSALGRPAGDAEVAFWRPAVNGPNGRVVVANAIERSQEARTRLVKSWYARYLGRQAGNQEEQGWVRALLTGATEEQVLRGLLGSQEYLGRAGASNPAGSTDESFVRTLFQDLLGRQAGQLEVSHFLRDMLPGAGRGGVAYVVLTSQEYRGKVVTSYYRDLLRRAAAPTPQEVSSWVLSALDLSAIRIGFKSSLEYYLNG
jgi:hypothetical protein